MSHRQASDPWAHLKPRRRFKLPLDFGEVTEPPPLPVPHTPAVWKIAAEERGHLPRRRRRSK